MSSPRYTSAESTLTISPPRRRAQSRASALLPEAVGPINAIAGGRGSCMACQPARMGVRTSGTSVAGFAQRSPHLLVAGLGLLRRLPVETTGHHDRPGRGAEAGHPTCTDPTHLVSPPTPT